MSNQSIARAAKILSLFSLMRPQLKVSVIAREMGLPVGTIHGLVRSMVENGLLTQSGDGREYRLGLRLIELGALEMATLEINQKAAIPANYLAHETGFIVRVGVIDRLTVIITYSSLPMTRGPTGPDLGTPVRAHCSSIGRSVMAFLPEDKQKELVDKTEFVKYTSHTISERESLLAELEATRERGHSVVMNELILNLTSIGAPIFGADGNPVGGISINADSFKLTEPEIKKYARMVMDTAAQISIYMGYRWGARRNG